MLRSLSGCISTGTSCRPATRWCSPPAPALSSATWTRCGSAVCCAQCQASIPPPPCAHLHLLWLAACLQVNISVAIVPMAQEFHWSPTVAGLVQSSFFWGYLLSQVQCGAVQCSAGWRAIKAIRLPPLLTSCLMVVTCWAVRHCCHCCCCCRCQAAWQRRGSAAAACCPPAYSFGLRPRQVREATITAVADCSAG